MIREVRAGKVPARDVFAALVFLNLSHSLIEGTLLVLMLGADPMVVLWLRLMFSVALVMWLVRAVAGWSDALWSRWLINDHAGGERGAAAREFAAQ